MNDVSEEIGHKVLELIESARRWGWRQAGGGVGSDEMEAQTKLRASELAAILRKLQQGADYVVVGYTLPLSDGSLSESAATFDTDHQFKRKVAVPLYAHVSSQDQDGGNGNARD